MIAERALAIFPLFGELEAPLQVGSGNSTIIVLAGALGTAPMRMDICRHTARTYRDEGPCPGRLSSSWGVNPHSDSPARRV